MTANNENAADTPKLIEMPPEMRAIIAEQTTRETFQGPVVIDGAPEHLGVAPAEATEPSRSPVVIEDFQGDPSRVIGHPSNPSTIVFGEKAPETPRTPAIPYLGQGAIEHTPDPSEK